MVSRAWRLITSGLRHGFEVDLRALAFARLGVGTILSWDLFQRALALRAHYTDAGVLPLSEMYHHAWGAYRHSLHALSGGAGWQIVLFALAAGAALALLLGWQTRWATLVCWVLTVSLQNRNTLLLTGGDTVLRMLLLWGIFLPWGARWSVDALLGGHPEDGSDGDEGTRPAGATVASAGTAGWMVQVALVHLMAGLLKTAPEWRANFHALYYALSLDQFQLPLGGLLLELPQPVLQGLTLSVMVAELILPFLLFPTFLFQGPHRDLIRGVAAGILMSFHVGLLLTLALGLFPWINLVSLAVFLPAAVWDRLEGLGRAVRALVRRPAVLLAKLPRPLRSGSPDAALPLPRWQSGLAMFLLSLVVLWNFASWNRELIPFPRPLRPLVLTLRMDQYWNLFAPRPLKDDGWWVAIGKQANGELVDAVHGGPPPAAKPEDVSARFDSFRWRKYERRMWLRRHSGLRPAWVRWMCREWKESHGGEEALVEVQLIYMREDTPPPGQEGTVRPVDLGTVPCL